MRKWDLIALFLLGLAAAAAASRLIPVPGYMDADYYYAGALRLARGEGLTEPFLWNYLDQPAGLPHPAFMYWMPLPSLLGAAGMLLSGRADFRGGQSLFLLLAASLPVLTAWLAASLGGARRHGWLAGLLALLPGYYLPYLLTIESFGLYMLLGTLVIVVLFPAPASRWRDLPAILRFLAAGVLAGAMHLSRADGLLWLAAVLLVAGWSSLRPGAAKTGRLLQAVDLLAAAVFGYFLVTGFWYWRNVNTFGSLLPPGGSAALWLTDYDQTYAYPAGSLNFASWWAYGFSNALAARLDALVLNLKTFAGVQSEIVLLPLIAAGAYRLRREPRVRFAGLMWLLTLLAMTAAFPFAGSRGGFFHSGAAFQPLLWALAAVGFDEFLAWGGRRRGWRENRARKMFSPVAVAAAASLTALFFTQIVIGSQPGQLAWRASWDHYQAVEARLSELGVPGYAVVMVNNPPGYYAAANRWAVAIPNSPPEVILQAANRYGAAYLILEKNHVRSLDTIYQTPGSSQLLIPIGPVGDSYIYQFPVPACE